ncbi:hypothetical protein H8R23_05045 [Flavobacterium sp. F-380]|uniref:Uncharacterized protein n=1 Tax=Flavobacterium kayseriense TaxID=2764714 RepID=A0ABR7J5E4_9FLAO|nr:hypothetical protein [Flavobacterium kayseriense]MBC5840764.1 hypothetical protein [Flavobacterium kayseriense]MBC5846566.1 hypothetical protein [Flavobacterium kayseriense]
MSEDLKKIAQELGIENAESLTAAQLKKAVAAAQFKLNASNAIKAAAVELGVETEGLTEEELTAAVGIALDEKLAKDLAEQSAAASEEVLAILSEYLGVDNISDLSVEEVKALLDQKSTDSASEIETVIEEEGKTDESFTAENGKEYVFTPDAPAAFRCLGVAKTQKEWLEDTDSMELLVAGNLSFLTLKK